MDISNPSLHHFLTGNVRMEGQHIGGLMVVPVMERPRAFNEKSRYNAMVLSCPLSPPFPPSKLNNPHLIPQFFSFHIVLSTQGSNYWKHLLKCLYMSCPDYHAFHHEVFIYLDSSLHSLMDLALFFFCLLLVP